MVIHGKGAAKSATLNKPPADGNTHTKDHDHGHEEKVEEEEGGEEVLVIGLMPISQEIASPSDSRDAEMVYRPSGWTKVRPLCF